MGRAGLAHARVPSEPLGGVDPRSWTKEAVENAMDAVRRCDELEAARTIVDCGQEFLDAVALPHPGRKGRHGGQPERRRVQTSDRA